MRLKLYGASNKNDGFGVAGRKIYQTLTDLGYDIQSDGNIHVTFAHPHQFHDDGDFNIGFFPWESTEPQDGWLKHLDRMDEIWVPSPWQQEIVGDWGFEPYVYEHGVDPIWQPHRRKHDKVRFLFMGLEALRKGGFEAIKAFRLAFPDVDDVELVIKTQKTLMNFPSSKITFVNDDLLEVDLVHLYNSCDVFVAPSWGEGFGLPGLQALATGMPVIATAGYLPYQDLIDPDLQIPSTLVESPWPDIHPGMMYEPDVDSLVDIYRDVYNHFNFYSKEAFDNAELVHSLYSWERQTSETFLALERRLLYSGL